MGTKDLGTKAMETKASKKMQASKGTKAFKASSLRPKGAKERTNCQ